MFYLISLIIFWYWIDITDYYFFTEFAANAVAQMNTKQLADRNRGNAPINSNF